MFQSARIKLTAWYLAIIMIISILFSAVIYSGVNREFEKIERYQHVKLERTFRGELVPRVVGRVDPELIREARVRFIFTLAFINIGILGFSGAAGYFLAGRTLRPIQEMIDEQNRFITDSSHELRTPLTSLKTSIEVNLRKKNLTLKDARKLLQSNLEEVNHLQTLSDDLIRLAQFQKANGNFSAEEVSIPDIIQTAIGKVKPLAEKKEIEIVSKTENAVIKADKKSISELFVILLDNAIKYSFNNTTLTVNNTNHKAFVEVLVTDQGMGIDSSELPHIFDRFYRAEKSRSKETIPGYGLGLSIAKKIVDFHKGSIGVKSKKDKGTTFTIRLPHKQSNSILKRNIS